MFLAEDRCVRKVCDRSFIDVLGGWCSVVSHGVPWKEVVGLSMVADTAVRVYLELRLLRSDKVQ